MEPSDECHTLLQHPSLQLNDYGSQRILTVTTGHCNRIVLNGSGGCESADVTMQHEMTSANTKPKDVGRKSSDQRLEQSIVPTHDIETHSDVESIVKLRLFFATAALWAVWLLVYVILFHWRFI